MSKQRQKGTGYENDLLELYLWEVFPHAKRAAQRGINDEGDFVNTRHFLFEAKKWNTWRIPTWIRQTAPKAERANRPWAILFAGDKRGGGPLADDFALLPTRYLMRLLKAAYAAETHEDACYALFDEPPYDPFEGLNDGS